MANILQACFRGRESVTACLHRIINTRRDVRYDKIRAQEHILSVNWRHIRLIDLVSAKEKNKSQLIDIVSQRHQTRFQYTDTTL